MCDTFVALSDVSALNSVILAKNSDRPAFDCQPMAYHEAKTFGSGEKLQLAYVAIEWLIMKRKHLVVEKNCSLRM